MRQVTVHGVGGGNGEQAEDIIQKLFRDVIVRPHLCTEHRGSGLDVDVHLTLGVLLAKPQFEVGLRHRIVGMVRVRRIQHANLGILAAQLAGKPECLAGEGSRNVESLWL